MVTVTTTAPVAALRAPRRSRWRSMSWGSVLIWVILTLLIIAPVACFLALAVSPRLFGQGPEVFTLRYVREAFSGTTGQGVFDSLWVSTLVALLATSVATAVAWLVLRTNVYGRRLWNILMWLLLLVPTWMMTLGWADLLQPGGVLGALHVNVNYVYGQFFGPSGIILVLTTAAIPFSYFVVSAGLNNLGAEYEDAARIHGAGRVRTLSMVLPIVAPALLSAFTVSFAETMSDFGVAFTLGYHSHFPLATYTLFNAISNYPANFSVAAVIAIVLILSTVPPIMLQSRVMRRRTYAVLSARTRATRRRELATGPRVAATLGIAVIFVVALGVPFIGATMGSFIENLGVYSNGPIHLTTTYYAQVFHPSIADKSLAAPLMLSNQMGFIVATATGVLAVVLAKRLVHNAGGWSQRITDVFLMGSIAVPGVVLGVGYIFFYNQSFITNNVVNLYKTLPLLIVALVANALPGQTRFMAGPVGQLQSSMSEAARVHGANRLRAWFTTSLPLMSRVLLWGWLLTFAKTITELAICQILYPPSQEPASVNIQTYLGNYQLATGTAMTVLTMAEMFGVIVIALGLYRMLTPRGWRQIGWSGVRS